MPIFIHTPNGIAVAEDIDGAATLARLTDEAGPSDSTARSADGDDPPETTDTPVGVTGATAAHVHLHPCRRVLVTVNCSGRQKQRRFIPTATIQAVRRWAVGSHGFNLPASEQPDHEVGVCDTGVVAERTQRVGALATRCALCLDLAPKERFRS
jgi:hypothetical protein